MYRCDSGGLYTLFCGFIFHGKVSIIPIFSLSISEYVGDLVFIFLYSPVPSITIVMEIFYSLGLHVTLFFWT